ncbi:MAG: fatty acid desaturase [Acidobacteriota bacterium]
MVSAASPLVQASPPRQAGRKRNYYARHTRGLKSELSSSLPVLELRRLHAVSSWKHLAVSAAQFAVLGLASWGLYSWTNPLFWIPLAAVQGFVIFNFTILLHEVLHENALRGQHPLANRILGLLYAVPTGISATQFTRWHLDHHDSLGSYEEDPKRHHLSPKLNRRWVKLLYFTPALFVIYFRAARRETATYPVEMQGTIRNERLLAMGVHLTVLFFLVFFLGWGAAARLYLVPYFLAFPLAFALNRLGQHYYIVPEDPAQWSTLMKVSFFWDLAFLWSSYHLEHHYFPRVPFYNMRRLRRLLQPFFEKRKMGDHRYSELVYHYIVLNKAPHTNWALELD